MTTLLYRGLSYEQHNGLVTKPSVKLTYRRSVYQANQQQVLQPSVQLTYRGIHYLR